MNQGPTIKKMRLPRSARNDNIVGLMNQGPTYVMTFQEVEIAALRSQWQTLIQNKRKFEDE